MFVITNSRQISDKRDFHHLFVNFKDSHASNNWFVNRMSLICLVLMSSWKQGQDPTHMRPSEAEFSKTGQQWRWLSLMQHLTSCSQTQRMREGSVHFLQMIYFILLIFVQALVDFLNMFYGGRNGIQKVLDSLWGVISVFLMHLFIIKIEDIVIVNVSVYPLILLLSIILLKFVILFTVVLVYDFMKNFLICSYWSFSKL